MADLTVGYAAALEQFPPTEILDLSVMAEANGFSGVMAADHFQPWVPAQGQSSFVWNVLAALGERTREIGLLRAVGLGRLQLATVVTIESVLTAVFGTVLGIGVGAGLASVMPTVFADEGFTALVVPWAPLGALLGLAVVVGALAAVWPAVRAARMDVLEAIAYE